MTGPFSVLGIAADADEYAIKIAYAKLLKLTRPDDDPEGFQRLNQAYRQALKVAQSRKPGAKARRASVSSQPMIATLNLTPNAAVGTTTRATRVEEPVHAAPSRPPPILAQPAPEPATSRPQRPAFDPQAFLAEYRHIANTGGAKALSRWLMDYPAFWHLPTKHAAGQWLLRSLFESPEAMPEGCFTATSEFFHYEDAISGADPLALCRVGARINAMSLVKPENHAKFARQIFGHKTVQGISLIQDAIRLGTGPFCWWRDLPFTMRPGHFARKVGRVLTTLCNGNPDDLPPPLDSAHARFWIEAGVPGDHRTRLLVLAFRCAIALLVVPLLFAGFVAAVQAANGLPVIGAALRAALVGLIVALGGIGLRWMPIGIRWLFRATDALAVRSRVFRLLMASLTPATCALAILLAQWVDVTLGTLVAIASMFAAVWRMRVVHRHRALTQFERVALVVAFFAYVTIMSVLANVSGLATDPALLPTLSIVLPSFAIWAIDWHKRGFLRPRTPRPMRTKLRGSRAA